jgi:hypothetical protein
MLKVNLVTGNNHHYNKRVQQLRRWRKLTIYKQRRLPSATEFFAFYFRNALQVN